MNELRRSFFTQEKKSNLVKDEFQGLVDGGFVLEKFIKVTDYEAEGDDREQWGPEWQRLSQGQHGDLAVQEILNRGGRTDLKGIVNLNAWEDWLSTLISDHHAELGIFTEVQGKTTINVQKFWANWEYGLRLVYVYPLLSGAQVEEEEREEFEQSGVHGSLWDETTYFKNTFMGVLTNGDTNPIRDEVANREKAYILNESVGFAVNINLGDDINEADNIDITSQQRAGGYKVATSPVATVLTSVRPEDIETIAPPPAQDLMLKVINAFETNVWNDVRDEYNRKREQILQMAYEPDHRLKQNPSEWCILAYQDEYDHPVAITVARVNRPGLVLEYFSEIHGETRRWTYPDIYEADLRDMCARYEQLKAEIDLETGPLGTKYARLSEIYDNLLASSWSLAVDNITLDEIRDHENGRLFIDTIGAIIGELQAMLDSDEVRMPCFGAQDPDFENRRSDFTCVEHDRLAAIIREMRYYRDLADRIPTGPPINIKHGYTTSAINVLRSDLKRSDEFKSLFEYIFPMKRFLTILTIYNAEYIGGLPGRREMFDTTKGTIRTLQATLLGTLNKDWWREKPRKGKKWWERSLALPVPMIILMTPFQILQMLLTLVPPLDWILGGLLRLLPKLPPHRSKKPKSVRCLPPPSRRGE